MFLENAKKSGCIEVICGSMFSGKTEELIRRLKRAQFAKQKIATFKPTIDKRYSDLDVVSHDSHSISCTPIKSPARMLQIDDDVQVVGMGPKGLPIKSVSRPAMMTRMPRLLASS